MKQPAAAAARRSASMVPRSGIRLMKQYNIHD